MKYNAVILLLGGGCLISEFKDPKLGPDCDRLKQTLTFFSVPPVKLWKYMRSYQLDIFKIATGCTII